jgi:hypothetical protein
MKMDFLLLKTGEHLKKNQTYKVLQNGYHAKLTYCNTFINQKTDFIHNNPVKDKIVTIFLYFAGTVHRFKVFSLRKLAPF